MKTKLLAVTGLCSLLLASCALPPMSAVIDPNASKKLASNEPRPSNPIKTHVVCDVSWGGEPAPLAKGYFTKRLTNALASISGFVPSTEKEADLVIKVSRNNKWNKAEMNEKVKRVTSKQTDGEAILNKYDHFFQISGQGKTWSGNVPHQLYLVVGNTTSTNVTGQIYSGTSGGVLDFKEMTQCDEAMIREVLVYALNQAKRSGCFR
jgi:hypothetical protein